MNNVLSEHYIDSLVVLNERRDMELDAELLKRGWRRNSMGKWCHSRLGTRRFTRRRALRKAGLLREPVAPAKYGGGPSPGPFTSKHPYEPLTPLRQLLAAK